MKRMLINASHSQELRVALVDGQSVYDLDIETASRKQQKSNIYKGIVTRVEPSLEAAFINFGAERHGFLPLKEVAREYYPDASNNEDGEKLSIKDILKEGQEIIIQVEKEQRGNKGAALTTYITLPGSYLVLMPNNPKAGGISRRIDGSDRAALRDKLNQLQHPNDVGVIVRTAGSGRNAEELQWDLDILLRHWHAIKEAATQGEAPFLIYQESNSMMRAIRDYLHKDIDEIIIDQKDLYEQAKEHIEMIRPDFASRVKFHDSAVPLFSRFQIESQIESAFSREVRLPSGGSIIIDHSEALVSIDINSSKATSGGDIEETAFQTNLEASDEIARQLRLRDLGGLVVIDYIDMLDSEHQQAVENRLHQALNHDRARIQVGQISRFGLLEMSRQRLRPSLGEATRITCPRCAGQGTIRGTESFSLSIIRLIEENVLKENTHSIHAQLPVEVATYLLNEKRDLIVNMQKEHKVNILIIPNKYMEQPHYQVDRIRKSDITSSINKTPSYDLASQPENTAAEALTTTREHEIPAIKHMPTPTKHHPERTTSDTKKSGVFRRVVHFLFGEEEEQPQHHRNNHNRNYRNNRGNHRNNRNNRGHNRNYRNSNHHQGQSANRPRGQDTQPSTRNAGQNQQRHDTQGQTKQQDRQDKKPQNRNQNQQRNRSNNNKNRRRNSHNRQRRPQEQHQEHREQKQDAPKAAAPTQAHNAPTEKSGSQLQQVETKRD